MAYAEPRHHLPVRLTSFVGRERELTEVAGLLDRARLVTLVGAPGVGKTRLALELAQRLTDEAWDRFADGIAFVELASLTEPTFVPNVVAAALGIQERADRPLLALLAEQLATRHLLLVLDNCEHLILACATLVETLLPSAPGLVVVATSREPLRAEGEVTWRVPSLSIPDAEYRTQPGTDPAAELTRFESARLLLDRARAAVPAFTLTSDDARAILTICRRLDGIPLAIELAAARVSALSVAEIATRLDSRLALLSGGRRTALPRQQTLRGAIDWSYDLLTDEERRLLRRLAVFAGGCTVGAGCWVAGHGGDLEPTSAPIAQDPISDTLDVLVSLVDKSLVQIDDRAGPERRYRLLEMVRQYGLEKLRDAGEELATRRRHLVWCAELARLGRSGVLGPDGAVWAERLTAELDNARAALAWSLEEPDRVNVSLGLRIAHGFQPLWFQRDHLLEGWHWLEQLLAADPRSDDDLASDSDDRAADPDLQACLPDPPADIPDPHPRVGALLDLTSMALPLRRLEQGEAAAEEALALARRVGDRHGEAAALSLLGSNIYRAAGQYERAIEQLAESLPIFRQLGHRGWIVHALIEIGETVGHHGDLDRAQPLLEEAVALAREDGAPWQIGLSLKNLGVVMYRQGDLDRGQALLNESLVVFERIRATRGLSFAHWDLGHLFLARGDPQRAAECFAESFRLCHEVGDQQGPPRCLEGLAGAAILAANGHPGPLATYSAQLLGRAAVQRTASGIQVPPVQRPAVERAIEGARSCLGDAAYEAAFSVGRDLPLAQAAERALELVRAATVEAPSQVAAPPAPVPDADRRSPLSAREREVAELVAAGLTNPQIAARLVIGGRTVQSHVASILTKLDFQSRAQIAAWVARR
ncbi:MAG: tetratricopeptide repeat protein [Chloroflexota bacterium]